MDIKFIYIRLFSVILFSEVPVSVQMYPKHGTDFYMMYHRDKY